MALLLIFLVSLISVSIFDALPIIIISRALVRLQKESIKVITSKELSDDQKQRALFLNSGRILISTLKLVSMILISTIPYVMLILIWNHVSCKTNIITIIVSLKGILISTATFFIYFLIRNLNGKFRI